MCSSTPRYFFLYEFLSVSVTIGWNSVFFCLFIFGVLKLLIGTRIVSLDNTVHHNRGFRTKVTSSLSLFFIPKSRYFDVRYRCVVLLWTSQTKLKMAARFIQIKNIVTSNQWDSPIDDSKLTKIFWPSKKDDRIQREVPCILLRRRPIINNSEEILKELRVHL